MRDKIRLNIGCGPTKSPPGFIGIDQIAYPNVDIVGNALEILRKYPESSIDEILMSHFINHIVDWSEFFFEIERVLVNTGKLVVISPHFSNPYFYSDPTHVNSTGLYSMSYFFNESLFARKVPKYFGESSMFIVEVKLIFKSPRPFYIRYALKRILELFINSSRYMQEFYEENLSGVFSAYEIKFVIVKK